MPLRPPPGAPPGAPPGPPPGAPESLPPVGDDELRENGLLSLDDAEEDFKTGLAFMAAIRSLEPEMIFRLTGSWRELVLDCTYQGKNCTDEKYFIRTVASGYGICYTFNSNFNTNDSKAGKRISSLTGSDYGLSLELYLDQDDYMSNVVSESAGVRVVVHDNDQLPIPDEQGFYLRPNTHTTMALTKVNITRLPEPYQSRCFSSWKQTSFVPLYRFDETIPIGYNVV
ncbi:unnamed protein product, partial [Darwinula stevensoni]